MLGNSYNEKFQNGLIIIFFFIMLAATFFYRKQIFSGTGGFGIIGNFPDNSIEKNYPLITEKSDCENAGGVWEERSENYFFCVYYYSDGGAECVESSDCEGICVINETVEYGQPIVGKCLSSSILYGCFSEIGRYKQTGAISCVD